MKSQLTVLNATHHVMYQLDGATFETLDLETGERQAYEGVGPVASISGDAVAFFKPGSSQHTLFLMRIGESPREIFSGPYRIQNLALSPDGGQVAFQAMPRENWELMIASADTSWQLTREIQHDLFPRFIDENTVFAVTGEGRHRRSFLHDAQTGKRTRIFHNNTIRTVAPEYEWALSPDGSKAAIVAERDGDTISPERGVYLVDFSKKISKDVLIERLDAMLIGENELRVRGSRLFEPVAEIVREALQDVSTTRSYGYERDLFAFG
jgi:Tol biopolymer transport system component